jgi:hypothetical protein
MGYWARQVRRGGRWISITADTPEHEIPLNVLADLTDGDDEVSFWLVPDLGASLLRVAAALQPKNQPPAKTTFRAIDGDRWVELGIPAPRQEKGFCLDAELNRDAHYVIDIATNGIAIKMAKAPIAIDEVSFTQARIVDEMLRSIRQGRILLKEFERDLCKWLVKEGNLVPPPEAPAAAARAQPQGETPT